MMVQVVGFQSDFFCIARVLFSVERSLGMLFGFSLIFLDDFLNGYEVDPMGWTTF